MDQIYPLPIQHSPCGYCKDDSENDCSDDHSESKGTFVTESAWAVKMRPESYKLLIDGNWRRSGCYLYRPIQSRICCHPYAIRVSLGDFCPSSSQRKAVRRFFRFDSAVVAAVEVNFFKGILTEMNECKDFTWSLHSSQTTPESEESFNLYQRYQEVVHGDSPKDLSIDSYRRFLIDNPFGSSSVSFDHACPPFGAYHLCWRYKGRLIAVSVIDLLPECLSSVYFYYDPDFAHLSLGTVSACLEMAMAWRWFGSSTSGHYYLGYYIDNCPKMRYKARFGPSQILDPITFRWDTFQAAQEKYHWSIQ